MAVCVRLSQYLLNVSRCMYLMLNVKEYTKMLNYNSMELTTKQILDRNGSRIVNKKGNENVNNSRKSILLF